MSDTPLIQPAVVGEGVYEEGREASTQNHGHIKSYVRRAGRMSSAQENYYAEMMPKIGVVYAAQQIDLAAVYGRNAPKILEIGTGMGETTAKPLKSFATCCPKPHSMAFMSFSRIHGTRRATTSAG